MDKSQRIQQIIQQTRVIFLHDASVAVTKMNQLFTDLPNSMITPKDLAKNIYRGVHGIKGLALTLSYEHIHCQCERIDTFILQQEGWEWSISAIHHLKALVDPLAHMVMNEFHAEEL